MSTPAAPRGPFLIRALRRLWDLRREERPLLGALSLSFYRGDRIPNYLIAQTYMAWQAAWTPRWDADARRHVLRLSPGRLLAGLRAMLARLRSGAAFHRLNARGAPPADAPKVQHVIAGLEIGGSEKLALDVIEGLGHRYRMRVLTGLTVRHARYAGLDVAVRTSADEIAAELRRDPPDLIHLHYWGMVPWMETFLAGLARSGVKAPVLGNMNNAIPPLRHPAIAHHAFVSRYAAQIEPRADGPWSVVYPGLEPADWAPAPRRAEPPFPTMGLMYRLDRPKLEPGTIDALIEIVRRRPETLVLIPGGGPLLPYYVDRVTRAGARANFHFMGWVPFRDLPAFYDRLDLYVAPVEEESFGVVVPYAMFKGVPVLAYRVGALPEILGDERWLCADRGELAARAAEALGERARRREEARALRESAGRFSLAAMLDAYDELYRRLLKNP